MPSTATAVKNSVLFALLILIVHVIAKNNASAAAAAAHAGTAAAHAGTATAHARPERSQRAAPVPAAEPEEDEDEEDPFERPDAANAADSADLLEYVFGKKADAKADGHESTTSFGSKDAFNGSSKASNEQVVVGKYDNESVMCGGPLFGGGLECFDGAGSSYQLL